MILHCVYFLIYFFILKLSPFTKTEILVFLPLLEYFFHISEISLTTFYNRLKITIFYPCLMLIIYHTIGNGCNRTLIKINGSRILPILFATGSPLLSRKQKRIVSDGKKQTDSNIKTITAGP